MGLFGSSTKIHVASSAYNLAGDIAERPDYLKTTIIGSVVSKTNAYLGNNIPRSYLNGPGMRMRHFYRWAKDNYEPTVGTTVSDIQTVSSLDNAVIADQIPRGAGESVVVQSADIGFGDIINWGNQYVYANRPDKMGGTWEVDYDGSQIVITYPDNTTDSFVPSNYDQNSLYLYALHNLFIPQFVKPPVTGSSVVIADSEPFPDMTGYVLVSDVDTTDDVLLDGALTVTQSWADGRPDVVNVYPADSSYSATRNTKTYTKNEYMGVLPGEFSTTNRARTQYHVRTARAGPYTTTSTSVTVDDNGVWKTTTYTYTVETPEMYKYYREDYLDTDSNPTGRVRMFIYKQGSGNAVLDSMFSTDSTGDEFFPYVPIRLENWVDGSLYALTKKAIKKATGGNLDDIVTALQDNADINDIQYIYAVFGCSLNTKEDTAKEYIYRFFKRMMISNPSYVSLSAWINAWNQEYQKDLAWKQWYSIQQDYYGVDLKPPQWAAPEPPKPNYPVMPRQSLRIFSTTQNNYDMEIAWTLIEESTGSGQAWVGAKIGELRIEGGGRATYPYLYSYEHPEKGMREIVAEQIMDTLIIRWQDGVSSYRVLTVYGAGHRNRVYDGKAVEISSKEALEDPEESGFIVPLHNGIMREMSLVRSTQMNTACNYLLLNCYKRVKKKWYQTGLFKVVLVVVVVIVTIYSGGAGASTAGVLGTNIAVGTALGFAGMAAVIAGAIANAFAAMILTSIIQSVSVSLFGDKLGLVIGTIASLLALQTVNAMQSGQTLSESMNQMMSADTLLRAGSTMLDVSSQYLNARNVEIVQETERILQGYQDQAKEITDKYIQEFGVGTGSIDPMIFVNSVESSDAFLSRTLMTGTDIANMTNSLISEYTNTTLKLPLP